MGRVRIITDTSCDIPPELVKRLDIGLVPLVINVGTDSYLDREQITIEQVADLVKQARRLTVSLPPPGLFIQAYQEAAAERRPVVSLHVSGRLSGTCRAAELAATMARDADVVVVDSGSGTMGLGWQVVEAARLAAAGADRPDVLDRIERIRPRIHLLFALTDLTHLHRIGRIGPAAAWVGTLLQTRPILGVADGMIAPVARVRGTRRVVSRLVDLFVERVGPGRQVRMAVLYTSDPEPAHRLAEELRTVYRVAACYVLHMGPVVTAGIGPGAVGAALLEDDVTMPYREGDWDR